MNSEPASRNACKQWNGRTLGVLALGVLLSGVPALAQQAQPQQNQQGQPDQQAPPPQNQGQDQQAAPPPPPPPDQTGPLPPAAAPQYEQPAPPPQTYTRGRPANLPDALTIPAGTVIQVRTSDWLSSDRNKTGDEFIATLAQPIVVDGWVVMRRNQNIIGRVTDAKRAFPDCNSI